jgi:hypothetical protein
MSMLQTYATRVKNLLHYVIWEYASVGTVNRNGMTSDSPFLGYFNYFCGIMTLYVWLYPIYVMCNWIYLYYALLLVFFISLLEGMVCFTYIL